MNGKIREEHKLKNEIAYLESTVFDKDGNKIAKGEYKVDGKNSDEDDDDENYDKFNGDFI